MTVTPPDSPTRRDFPELDAMRAMASIAVVATHTAFWAGTYSSGFLGAATQRLEVGVAVFFTLSGFLLGRPYMRSALHGLPHEGAGRYAWKRALRVLPVYVVCVVAAMLLIADNRELGAHRWAQNLLLVDLYRAEQLPQGLTQMWSLSVEVAFYALLPLIGLALFRLVRRRRRPDRVLVAVLIGSCVASMAWVVVTHSSDAEWSQWAARWLPAYFTWFALGLLLSVIEDLGTSTRFSRAVVWAARDRLTCWIGALVVLLFSATPLGGDPSLVAPTTSEALVRHVCYAAVAFLLIAPCVLKQEPDAMSRVLTSRPARHLGRISYSLFCCHMIVLYLLTPRLGLDLFQSSWAVLLVVVLGSSLVISHLLYRFVERPFLALKGWSPRRTATVKAPSDTPTSS